MPVTKLSYLEALSQQLFSQIPIHDGLEVRLNAQLARVRQTLGVFLTYGKGYLEKTFNEDQR